MDKLKQWVALAVVAALAIGAGGWFLLISPKRSEAADVRTQVEQQNSQNSALSTRITMLKAQAKALPQQQAKLAAVAAKIPDNPALPALIRALTKAADQADVELTSLSPAAPVVLAAPAAATTTPVAPAAAPGAVAPAAAPVAAAAAPAVSVGTLSSIALTINVVGGYFQVERFFDQVENLSRATKVTGFSLAPGTDPTKTSTTAVAGDPGKTLGAAITATVYMATGRTTVAPAAGK